MKKLNAEQLQTFTNFIQAHQLKEAKNLLIETIQLSPKAAENLVQLLNDSHDALKMFKDNPQILDQEHQSSIKTESKSFEINFHSSKVKITDKDGRSIEINDQQPEWESIKK